jgi:hypothetical protein
VYPPADGYRSLSRTAGHQPITVDEAKFDTRCMLEDHNMNTVTLQAAIEALNGSKMISPTKYALTIEARVYHRRHNLPGRLFGAPCDLCTCLSQTEHIERMRMEDFLVDSHTSSRYSSSFTKTVECEQWDCVLLFESLEGELCLLIIKWKDDVAYRVDTVQEQPFQVSKFCSRPNIKRRIRMG